MALYLGALGGLTGNGISTQTIPISVQSGPTCDGTLRTGQSVVVLATTPLGSLLLKGAYTYSHYIDQVSEVFATDSTASSFQSLLFNRENFGLVFPTTPTAATFGDVLNTPAPATLGSHPLFLDFGQTEAVGRNMRMGLKLSW